MRKGGVHRSLTNQQQQDQFTIDDQEYVSKQDFSGKSNGYLKLLDTLKNRPIKKTHFLIQKKNQETLETVYKPSFIGENLFIADLPDGRYLRAKFFDKNNVVLSDWEFSNKGQFLSKNPNIFGVVEVCLDKLLKTNYEIKFKAKKAFWNFIVNTKSEGSPEITYTSPSREAIKLIYGEDNLVFKEKQLDDLEKSYQKYIQKLLAVVNNSQNKLSFFRSTEQLPVSEILNDQITIKFKIKIQEGIDEVEKDIIENALTNPSPDDILNIKEVDDNHLFTYTEIRSIA